jgi:acyl-CoA synthetase (AMP-forming)/AMP-acid ligase II
MDALIPSSVTFEGRLWSRRELRDRAVRWRGDAARRLPRAPAPVAMVMANHPDAVALLAALASFPSPVVLLPPEPRAWITSPAVPAGTVLFLPAVFRDLAPAGEAAGMTTAILSEADAGAPPASSESDALDPVTPGLVFLTSGSSGRPKPVYRTLASVVAQSNATAEAFDLRSGAGVLGILSQARNFGFNRGIVQAAVANAPLGLHASFDARAILTSFGTGAYEHVAATPLFVDLLSRAAFPGTPPPAPRVVNVGGARLSAGVTKVFADRFGVTPGVTYGSTECGAVTCALACADGDAVGRPLPGVRLRVGPHPDRPVPAGREGPIWVSSPWCMEGYGYPPVLDRASFVEGWLSTGDVGALVGHGELKLRGRVDDCFKTTANHLVDPRVIADALADHPGVGEAAVVPLAERNGTSIGALVAARGPLDAADLRRHTAIRLPPWAVPHHIKVIDALPRLADGKIDRVTVIADLARHTSGGR